MPRPTLPVDRTIDYTDDDNQFLSDGTFGYGYDPEGNRTWSHLIRRDCYILRNSIARPPTVILR